MDESELGAWVRTLLLGVILGVAVLLAIPDVQTEIVTTMVVVPAGIALSFLFAAIALSALHESAHAIVARLVGSDVLGVTLGRGRRLARFNVGTALVEIRQSLVGGYTLVTWSDRRWRDAAVLLAGIAVEAAVLAVILPWQPTHGAAHILRAALIGVASIDIVLNAWPQRLATDSFGDLLTDGARLWALARNDAVTDRPHDRSATIVQLRILQTIEGGDVERAVDLARTSALEHPDDTQWQRWYGTTLVLCGRWRAGFDVLEPLSHASDTDPEAANNAAWAAVMTFDPALLATADHLSLRAFTMRPTSPAVLNTRGATLVVLGRPDEGLPMLELAARSRLTSEQRAFVASFMALGELALGRRREAWVRFDEIDEFDRRCPARAEVERRLQGAAPAI